MTGVEEDLIRELWAMLGGAPAATEALRLTGTAAGLPSVFDVDGLAAAVTGVATLAAAELAAARRSAVLPDVTVDRRHASAAFAGESLLRPEGWRLPPIWDPIAGVYRTAGGGWIRLHTNYPWHRAGALRALGIADDPGLDADRVAAAVRTVEATELESRVVAAGGCAAQMHTPAGWARHPQQLAVSRDPVIERAVGAPRVPFPPGLADPSGQRPLAGIRVLDLTRVIAGPVATRALASWGADVLRIDPPGFPEVPAVLPEVTVGKRCAALDLRDPADRTRFEELLVSAHVLVHGLRPGALDSLGFGPDRLARTNPSLVVVTHDAYGWQGPWAGRRGFDSLVQLSTGLAAAAAAARGVDEPVPLPVQALDHGTGHLLAAAACRGVTDLVRGAGPSRFRASLTGTARLLAGRPVPGGLDRPAAAWTDADTAPGGSAWGPVRRVPPVGTIGGEAPAWDVPAGPLGRDEPVFVWQGVRP